MNGRGDAVTASGLVVPSYAGIVGNAVPTSVNDPAIAKLAAAMQQLRG